jgi:hypothetical protein
MKSAKRWLLWKEEWMPGKIKPSKVPYYVNGSRRVNVYNDNDKLVTYQEAYDALDLDYTGLGFALGDDGTGKFWQGIDLDNTLDPNVMEELRNILPSYVEVSPSGKGYHSIGYGDKFESWSNGGIEVYSHGRYFTFTGHIVRDDKVIDIKPFVQNTLGKFKKKKSESTQEFTTITVDEQLKLRDALNYIRCEDRKVWQECSFHLYGYGDVGLALWLSWGQLSEKYDPVDAMRVWRSADGSSPNIDAVFNIAREAGWIDYRPMNLDDFAMMSGGIEELQPTEYVIENFIEVGAITLSGSAGFGKTTQLVPLAAKIAWLCSESDWLKPVLRRKVIYIAEDVKQVNQALFSIKTHGDCVIDSHEFSEWFHVIPASRMSKSDIGEFVKNLRGKYQYVQHVVGDFGETTEYLVEPLIIFDTTNACMEIKDINNNGEASAIISAVRQASGPRTPVWFVRHVAKMNKFNSNSSELTSIGATAWEGDVQGTMSLTVGDNGERYISLGKCRHTPKFKELMSSATLHNHIIDTPWGVSQQIGIWNCKFEVFIRHEKEHKTKKFEFTALYTKTFELISYGKTLEENVNIIHAAGIYTRRFNVTKTLNLFIDNGVIEIENNIILPVL